MSAGPLSGAEQLLSVLAHDLRSPLTVIRGAASLLASIPDLPPAKRTELLGLIESESGRMADKIEAILVAHRLESGRLRLFNEDFDLASVVTEALESVRGGAEGRTLATAGDLEALTARGDRDRAAQVLREMLDNACRHTPAGTPVEVAAIEAGGMIRVEVRDHGAGIAEADREVVFERLRRLSESGSGAGLGLYVARGLVAAMGGETGVAAGEGGGSVFWFTLPSAGITESPAVVT